MLRTRLAPLTAAFALAALALASLASPALATEIPTPAPVLFSPAGSSASSPLLHVHYLLPEAAAAGSLVLSFEGSAAIELVLSEAEGTSGEHDLTINLADPLGSPAVLSSTASAISEGSYSVKLTYEGVAATAPESATNEDVVIDAVTQAPSLLAPAGGSVIGEQFTVEYSLPEAASPGTVGLLFTGPGAVTSILELPATAAGVHSVTLNPFDLALGGPLVSGPEALSGGEYSLAVAYQDAVGNPLAFSGFTKFIFAHPTPAPVLIAPGDSTSSSAQLSVRYDLPEEALAGDLTLTFEHTHSGEGTEPFEVTLANDLGASGEHEATLDLHGLLSSPTLVAGATAGAIPDGSYTVTLSYGGVTGTSPASVSAENVVIDTVTRPPVVISPVGGRVIREDFIVEYSLPESANPGTGVLELARTNGATSVLMLPAYTAGTHSVTLDPSDLAIGGLLTSGPLALASGGYTLRISYQDALLNPAASSSATFAIASAGAQPAPSEEPASESPPAAGSSGSPPGAPAKTATTGATGATGATAALPAHLSVQWRASPHGAGRTRALIATFAPVPDARSYTLAISLGRGFRSVFCHASGPHGHRQVRCLVGVPSKGRWAARAVAHGPVGALAEASTVMRFRS